jgi:hypothetical protein
MLDRSCTLNSVFRGFDRFVRVRIPVTSRSLMSCAAFIPKPSCTSTGISQDVRAVKMQQIIGGPPMLAKDVLLILHTPLSVSIGDAHIDLVRRAAQSTRTHLLILLPSKFPRRRFSRVQLSLSKLYTEATRIFYDRDELLMPVDIVIDTLRKRKVTNAFDRTGYREAIEGGAEEERRLCFLLD